MRQGGLKPKSHKSGVHWVRASAQNNRRRKAEDKPMPVDGLVIFFLLLIAPFMLVAWLIDWIIKITAKAKS